MKTWTQRVAQIALVSTGLLAVGAGLASAATEPTGAPGGDQVTKPVTDPATTKVVANPGATTTQATTGNDGAATTGAATDPVTGAPAGAAKPVEGTAAAKPGTDPATSSRPADTTATKPVEAKPAQNNNNSPTKAIEDAVRLDALTELTKKLTSRSGDGLLQQRSAPLDDGFGSEFGRDLEAGYTSDYGDGFSGYVGGGDFRGPGYESVFESYQAMAMADAYQNLSSSRPASRPEGRPEGQPDSRVTATKSPSSSKLPASPDQAPQLGQQKLPSTEQVATEVVKGVPLSKELSQQDLGKLTNPQQVDQLAGGTQQVEQLAKQVPVGELTKGGLTKGELNRIARQLPGTAELRRLPTGDITRKVDADAITRPLDVDRIGKAVRAITDETRGGTFTRPAELTGNQSLRSLTESGLVEKAAAGAQELSALDRLSTPVERLVQTGVPSVAAGGK
ncbi:hypothetical protein [Streptoalloteichus hindustanus]|uniref:Uncharacterized protein n=1 Tax=Streptoalloteichus hindustanus TaxID=2017 RepID=A0A1M4V017_STRHI|nr:hypothetical protein [Streptoalloteichus hindustanus]SHE62227.1 hypothetical protein SAMN05444320_101593 [Streptoalloteichus hindustanus]